LRLILLSGVWIAQQPTEAFPWNEVPRCLIRDQHGFYGPRRLRAMGIRGKPNAPGSPLQNAYVERLIGTIRWEYLDHMIVFEKGHLHVADWHRWENPGDFLAAKLLQGILSLGISRYHPNPKAAIAQAEVRTDAATKRGAPQRDGADHDDGIRAAEKRPCH
jgi:hypothetical protein